MAENEDSVEVALRRAGEDVFGEVSSLGVPDFSPNRRTGPTVLGMLAVLLVGAGAFFALRDGSEPTIVETEPIGVTAIDPDRSSDDGLVGEDLEEDNTQDGGTEPDASIDAMFESLVTITDVRLPDALARPAVGQAVIDPAFGTTVRRITNTEAGESVTPVQSPASAFNTDASLLLLYRQGAGHELYDVETAESLGLLDIEPSDIEQVYWSPVDPEVLFFAQDLDLISFNTTSRMSTVLTTIDPCSGGLAITSPLSWDGETIAARCTLQEVGYLLITHQVSSGIEATVHWEEFGDLYVSPDGDRFVFVDARSGEAEVLNEYLQPLGIVFPTDGSTAMTRDELDEEWFVSSSFDGDSSGSVVRARLDDGERETATGLLTGYPFPPGGTRLGVAPSPFVAVSAPGISDLEQWDALDGEVLLVDGRDASPVTYRIAHNRVSPSDDYFHSSFVAVSNGGCRVAFSSDWGTGDRADTYVVDLGPC